MTHNPYSDVSTGFLIENVPESQESDIKLIDLITDKMKKKSLFFSIEVLPNSHLHLDYNTFTTLPLFTSITWTPEENLKSSTDSLLDAPAIKLGMTAKYSTPILQHLTCYNLTEQHVSELVSGNVRNVLALRGDVQSPNQKFKDTIELIEYIRKEAGSDISIGVAGYPDVHPDAVSAESDINYLKEKVDAGADYIITQAVFTTDSYLGFLEKCRAVGIQVPILPEIYLPSSYKQLQELLQCIKASVPDHMIKEYENCAEDNTLFQTMLIKNSVQMVRQLFNNPTDPIFGVHFCTFNNLRLLNDVLVRLEVFGIKFLNHH